MPEERQDWKAWMRKQVGEGGSRGDPIWRLMRRLQGACATSNPGRLNSRKKISACSGWAGSGRGRGRMKKNAEMGRGGKRKPRSNSQLIL